MKSLKKRVFPAGALIFREGDTANCAYLLKSGKVELSTYNKGKYVSLTEIQPNQLFGELALIDDSPRSATATAKTDCEAIIVHPDDIERQLDNVDEFMRYWVHYLAERVRDLSKRVEE